MVGCRRGQKERQISDVLRSRGIQQGRYRRAVLSGGGWDRSPFDLYFRCDQSGADTVNRDIVLGPPGSETLGQADEAAFSCQ